MNTSESIADRIEEVIGDMFAAFRPYESGATEYCMFYDPKKHSSWLIVIFFSDKNDLTRSLKDGICYQIHKYIKEGLDNHLETTNIKSTIFFEPGHRPVEQEKANDLFNSLLKKIQGPKDPVAFGDKKMCGYCGHDLDNHELLFNKKSEEINMPTEGWIACPAEGCNCFQTWSANYKPDQQTEQEPKKSKFNFLNLLRKK